MIVLTIANRRLAIEEGMQILEFTNADVGLEGGPFVLVGDLASELKCLYHEVRFLL